MNLFRAIENPYDRLALVGVLRSPLGGLTDEIIYELHREHLLDYREVKRLKNKAFPTTVAELCKSSLSSTKKPPSFPWVRRYRTFY